MTTTLTTPLQPQSRLIHDVSQINGALLLEYSMYTNIVNAYVNMSSALSDGPFHIFTLPP